MFWNKTREDYIEERVSRVVSEITDGEYSDKEIADFITSLTNRSMEYLKSRRLHLENKFQENIDAINKISNNE